MHPVVGLRWIGGHAISLEIKNPQVGLCGGNTLVCGFAIPLGRGLEILLHALAELIH